MSTIKLRTIAHARSGDKGSDSNIGVIATNGDNYKILKKHLTSQVVKQFFSGIATGDVVRYELPNLNAFNFIVKGALGTGGASSLRTDAQGKTLGEMLLNLEIKTN